MRGALNLHYGAGLQASGFFDWLYPLGLLPEGGWLAFYRGTPCVVYRPPPSFVHRWQKGQGEAVSKWWGF